MDFFHALVSLEWENRQSGQLAKRVKRAKLPYTKTIHDFDFSFQPTLSEQRVKETLTCRYIANGENRILLGPPGVGKTHLAAAFALEAITQGATALFLTADDMAAECQKAEAKGTLSRLIGKWSRPDLLIIDEVGYFPLMCFSKSYPAGMKRGLLFLLPISLISSGEKYLAMMYWQQPYWTACCIMPLRLTSKGSLIV